MKWTNFSRTLHITPSIHPCRWQPRAGIFQMRWKVDNENWQSLSLITCSWLVLCKNKQTHGDAEISGTRGYGRLPCLRRLRCYYRHFGPTVGIDWWIDPQVDVGWMRCFDRSLYAVANTDQWPPAAAAARSCRLSNELEGIFCCVCPYVTVNPIAPQWSFSLRSSFSAVAVVCPSTRMRYLTRLQATKRKPRVHCL